MKRHRHEGIGGVISRVRKMYGWGYDKWKAYKKGKVRLIPMRQID